MQVQGAAPHRHPMARLYAPTKTLKAGARVARILACRMCRFGGIAGLDATGIAQTSGLGVHACAGADWAAACPSSVMVQAACATQRLQPLCCSTKRAITITHPAIQPVPRLTLRALHGLIRMRHAPAARPAIYASPRLTLCPSDAHPPRTPSPTPSPTPSRMNARPPPACPT
jgi:hypothetical protein